jgi:NTE family protein
MTLSTLIHAGLTRPSEPRPALVLMGGGARTAYQAGVLKALASILRLVPGGAQAFPFKVLVGTSAGALNASYLAARAARGLDGLDEIAQFWSSLHSHQVYRLDVPMWMRFSRIATAWHLARTVRAQGALLDNTPLVDTLHKSISLPEIDQALAHGHLHALAVTAASYPSGVHWTFCHTARDASEKPWHRPGRRAEFQPITVEHLMASSAIPLIFPSTPLWVDGHAEHFGDGSMRQTSPLSPALHLGATRALVIGVGQPERGMMTGAPVAKAPAAPALATSNGSVRPPETQTNTVRPPGMGGILGYALASVFHDTLQGDVEQAQRMNDTLRQLPREVAAVMPYRQIDVLSIHPSESLDDLARAHAQALPREVRDVIAGLSGSPSAGVGAGGAALASYLLFEPAFTRALIALGERDAFARKDELLGFLHAAA